MARRPHRGGSGPTCAGRRIKTGAPARGERVAKYNRLIEISATNPDLPYGLAPG